MPASANKNFRQNSDFRPNSLNSTGRSGLLGGPIWARLATKDSVIHMFYKFTEKIVFEDSNLLAWGGPEVRG